MRIESFDRVIYENNPLAEVVCQVQFQRTDAFTDVEVGTLKTSFAEDGYTNFNEDVSVSVSLPPPPIGGQGTAKVELPQTRIHHFSTSDGAWRVSVCSEFIALTCLKYPDWSEFSGRLMPIVRRVTEMRQPVVPTRLGLRYKDLIEREPLGLDGVPWHELVAPFLLGPLAPNALAEGQVPPESEVLNVAAQSLLRLDSSMLLLQSALLTSIQSNMRAFLIDADFFLDQGLPSDLLTNPATLRATLDTLHVNAGALFRRGITERLHHALRPRT